MLHCCVQFENYFLYMKKIISSFLVFVFYYSITFGQTMNWQSLSSEVDGFINCLTVYDGQLIAGGHFSIAGTTSANKVAAWDGLNWSNMGNGLYGSSNPFVEKSIVFDNAFYVVGNFDSAGTALAKDIAKWDGTSWSALGTGSNNVIFSIATYNNEIYVGGTFDSIGGIAANHIAKWDGINWQPLSNGIHGNNVNDLYVYDNELYAVGVFDSAGSVACEYIARWNGSSWNNVAGGIAYGSVAMIEWDNSLVVGSNLNLVMGQPFLQTNQWNGSSWSFLSEQTMFQTRAFVEFDDKLYCSGGSGIAFGSDISLVAVWEDPVWTTVGTGVNYYIQGLCEYNGELYCGGFFNTSQGSNHNYIARLVNTASTEEALDQYLSVSIFPNPSVDGFTIDINVDVEAGGMIFTVYDLIGKQVFVEQIFTTTILDFDKQGLYIWRLHRNGEIIKTGKLVIE